MIERYSNRCFRLIKCRINKQKLFKDLYSITDKSVVKHHNLRNRFKTVSRGSHWAWYFNGDHTKLPLELTRKGRFDEAYWLDLPSLAERQEIFKVLLARYNRNATKCKLNLAKLAEKTEGFSGAEIEQLIVSAMFSQFNDDGKEINQQSLLDQISTAVPFSVTNAEELLNMRTKAVGRLKVASTSGVSRLFELPQIERNPLPTLGTNTL